MRERFLLKMLLKIKANVLRSMRGEILTQKFNECPKEYERRNKVDLVKNEQMAESLIAISIVAKKIAKELMQPEKGEKDVKNKATNGNQRRCRESCI